jgi:uncharacterized membrane protein YcgQ (UPF0703/DUF1980 family)
VIVKPNTRIANISIRTIKLDHQDANHHARRQPISLEEKKSIQVGQSRKKKRANQSGREKTEEKKRQCTQVTQVTQVTQAYESTTWYYGTASLQHT